LINSLNINKSAKQKQVLDFNVNNSNIICSQPFKTYFDIKNSTFFIKLAKPTELTITIPDSPFPYFLKGKNENVTILDSFNETVLKLYGVGKAQIYGNSVNLKSNKKTIAVTDFIRNNSIELLNLDIQLNDYSKILQLKQRAIESLSTNIFAVNSNDCKFRYKDLNEFLKLAFLRKRYFNDYMIFLKDIMGISINNGILSVKPKGCICSDFTLSYEFNGEKRKVKFSPATEKNKFNFVSHKLGGKDNVNIGF